MTVLKSSTKIDKTENAIAYLRVSTKDQKENGNSLTTQEIIIKKYCKENGLNLINTITESKSASKITSENIALDKNIISLLKSRTELEKIITTANPSKFKHLIVSTRDRLARNLETFVSIKLFLNSKGIKIHFANPNEEIKTKNAGLEDFIELIFASVAELEANLISERVRSGMVQKVKNGYWPGGEVPYGYVKKDTDNKKNKELIPSITEQLTVELIFKLHNSYGYSYRKIASILNKQDNTNIWNKNKIESIIRNKTYTGKVYWGRRRNRDLNSNSKECVSSGYKEELKIISEDDFSLSENIRTSKSKINHQRYYYTKFILSDKLICGKCNKYMKTKYYGYYKNGNPREGVYRCSCTTNLENSKKMVFKKSIIEDIFIKQYLNQITNERLDEFWNRYVNTKEKVIFENENKIESIERAIKKRKNILTSIKQLLNIEDDEIIMESLHFKEKIIIEEIKLLNNYKKKFKKMNFEFYKTKDEFKLSFNKLFKEDFKDLPNERKRMLIDKLIDKIVVIKETDSDNAFSIENVNKHINSIKLIIYVKAKFDIL